MIKCLVDFINTLIFKIFLLVSDHTVQDTSGLSSHLALAFSHVESVYLILILQLSKVKTHGLKYLFRKKFIQAVTTGLIHLSYPCRYSVTI